MASEVTWPRRRATTIDAIRAASAAVEHVVDAIAPAGDCRSWARGQAQYSESSGSLLEMPEAPSATSAVECFECWQRTSGARIKSGRRSTDPLAEVALPTA